MANIEYIKRKIKKLYETNPNVHINVKLTHPKLTVNTTPAVIKGVYPNIFRIEENISGHPRCHTVQYTEVLLGQVNISELGQIAQQ